MDTRARKRLLAEVKRAYVSGMSIRAIAVTTGRSYGSIHRLLDEAGVVRRPRGRVPVEGRIEEAS